MKNGDYTELICRRFCTFYKERDEGPACGTYDFLRRNLTPGEIESTVRHVRSGKDFPRDKEIKELICEQCDFLADGCDYREGLDAPPCGGYAIVHWLLEKSV